MNEFALILLIVTCIGSLECHKSPKSSCNSIAHSGTCDDSLKAVHVQLGTAYLEFLESFETLTDVCQYCGALIFRYYIQARRVGDVFYDKALQFLLNPKSNCHNYCKAAITAVDGMEHFFKKWNDAYAKGKIPNGIHNTVTSYIAAYKNAVEETFNL